MNGLQSHSVIYHPFLVCLLIFLRNKIKGDIFLYHLPKPLFCGLILWYNETRRLGSTSVSSQQNVADSTKLLI